MAAKSRKKCKKWSSNYVNVPMRHDLREIATSIYRTKPFVGYRSSLANRCVPRTNQALLPARNCNAAYYLTMFMHFQRYNRTYRFLTTTNGGPECAGDRALLEKYDPTPLCFSFVLELRSSFPLVRDERSSGKEQPCG